jgi:hypothetical protein
MTMKKYRKIVNLLLVCFVVFGFIGFPYSLKDIFSSVGRFESPKPLNGIIQTMVDDYGNIYYGSVQHSCIQVFDNYGSFQYGFSFPTHGGNKFSFFINGNNLVNVVVGESRYSFYNGYLQTGDALFESSIKNLEPKNFVDKNGNKYVFKNNHVIEMFFDERLIREIIPKVPIWPFNTFVYALFGMVGMVGIFLNNNKYIQKAFRKSSN